MITANDLREHLLTLTNSDKSEMIDSWLKSTVFSKWKGDKSGYEIPDGVSCGEIETLLSLRGFHVTTYSGYQGSFVYISLPSQGE